MINLDFSNRKSLFKLIFHLNLVVFTYNVEYYPYGGIIGHIFETYDSVDNIYTIYIMILNYL